MTIDFTNILDPDFPQIDRTRVRPSVKQVSILERTRCVDDSGADAGTFTDTTYPTYDECEGVIDTALELTLADVPDYLPESIYPRLLQAVALRAACRRPACRQRDAALHDGRVRARLPAAPAAGHAEAPLRVRRLHG
jgi:hypothetical protein